MCFGGGGGGGATIVKPDYNAYDKQFQLQKDAIERTLAGNTKLVQQQLNTALKEKQSTLEELTSVQKQWAENTNAQAMRLAQVIGPPPPEKHAQAPVIGAKARGLRGKGKGGLRIGRATASKGGKGSGTQLTLSKTY
tara:strand:- start:30 stop:440 length:411 start_codon:yes stop_codon:yes gene_type:complete